MTQEKGFFKKYGLDVQSVLIESGSTSAQSLIAGDVSFAHMAGAAIMQSNLRGADAVMIAGVINTLTFQLYTDKSISRPDQFKGKTVGVTRFGSSTDFAMRYALEKYGLDPNKDLTILQLGNVPALLAALEAGKNTRGDALGAHDPQSQEIGVSNVSRPPDARPRISTYRHSNDQIADQIETGARSRFHASLC